jgi:hypothetical protein
MDRPVWLGMCSCGEPTGLVVLAQVKPQPRNVPLPGHEGHTVKVIRLDHGPNDNLTPKQHKLLMQAMEVHADHAA